MNNVQSAPTKQQDGGDRPTKPHRVGGETAQQEQEQEPEPDAFSRYSSNLYRMKALLLCSEDDEGDDDLEAVGKINGILRSAGLNDLLDTNRHGNANDEDDSSKRRRGNDSQPIQQGHSRKTRISFELHPHLLLHDLFAELDMAESAQAISDDEEELELEDEKQPSQGSTKPDGKKEA
eukprot:scaffold189_cov124-Skeletonema_dohrnii-CCMP3373.AAC.8